MNPLLQLLIAFIITVVLEGAVMLALFRNRHYVWYSFLCNLLTNPALNFLLILWNMIWMRGYIAALVVLEVVAVVVEAVVYRKLCDFGFGKALLVSLLLNAASFAIGTAIFQLF